VGLSPLKPTCVVNTGAKLHSNTRALAAAVDSAVPATSVRVGNPRGALRHERAVDGQRLAFMSVAAPQPDCPKEPPDRERVDRILRKLGPVWHRIPDWRLAWLIVNLVPTGPNASDSEIELELDRLLDLTLE
jgi:hypothetical protein